MSLRSALRSPQSILGVGAVGESLPRILIERLGGVAQRSSACVESTREGTHGVFLMSEKPGFYLQYSEKTIGGLERWLSS